MSIARRTSGAAAAVLVVASLAGCSLVEASPPAPLTGLAACALGSAWKLDTAKLAADLQAELATRGIAATVTAEGSQTLNWDIDSHVALDSEYTVTFTSGPDDQKSVITVEHSGTATGIAYINSDVAIPRDWDGSGLSVTTTAYLNDVAQGTMPYPVVGTDLDDSVGIELTCDGNALTTHQRGSELRLNWTK